MEMSWKFEIKNYVCQEMFEVMTEDEQNCRICNGTAKSR
jgi:RNA polymerase subunit RPABC4/transcription elongation factor Spt4